MLPLLGITNAGLLNGGALITSYGVGFNNGNGNGNNGGFTGGLPNNQQQQQQSQQGAVISSYR